MKDPRHIEFRAAQKNLDLHYENPEAGILLRHQEYYKKQNKTKQKTLSNTGKVQLTFFLNRH
jgi:hypothetical protein